MRERFSSGLAALLLLALPLLGTHLASFDIGSGKRVTDVVPPPGQKAPPPVEPMKLRALTPGDARKINAAVPFAAGLNPAPRPFVFSGDEASHDRAIDCLAAAQYYEAGDDPAGQKAVAQVVLNRLRHPAFPKSVCAVVFQGSERTTGCQFTFTCDGAMARTPPPEAWDRARTLARRMLAGLVDRKIGYATHYHTDWVVPYWSSSLDKIAKEKTHLFFRWPGWWGTPRAFLRSVSASEPKIALLARLSPFHVGDDPSADPSAGSLVAPQMGEGAAQLAAGPVLLTARQLEGPKFASGAKLIATSPEKDSFIIALPKSMAASDYLTSTRDICSGRPRCRILGWRADTPPPAGFPIPAKALSSMLFSYIHDAQSGLQRLLWNCDRVPQDDPRNCMRERVPITVPDKALPADE